MTIKKCTQKDLTELIQIAKQSFIEAFEKVSNPDSFKTYVETAFQPEILRGELRDKQSVFYFLINDDNETVGYAKMRWDRSDEFFPTDKAIELQRIYFLEKHWNKGYGKVLLEFCENYGRKNGFVWIWLVVWLENHGAIRFYEREGWEKFGRKSFQFGNEIHNDFVLRKRL